MRLIQITDCHLKADPDALYRVGPARAQLEAVLARVEQLSPDVVIVTGDVSDDESPASYQSASRLFSQLGCPWYWIPGNHDAPDFMREIRDINEVVDLGNWQLLLLDSRLCGQAGGELGQDQLQRLAALLEEDARPALIALHHPPVSVGSAWMDSIGLNDREAFWQTLVPYAQVKAVLFGHVHHAFSSCEGDVQVYAAPATADQFLPKSDDFALDEASRPGFRVIELHGVRLTTWVERVDI
ncbi:phosphodiesterase [Phytohalomonas tamaricis]|uniref:phosphodiesterase n=1 Tax=Phytohalomonas tamaricis TaxID=2081032 RepID=UPI000D0AC11D|nr:phosphodiesterase [Phytohalomonas tamaricis]